MVRFAPTREPDAQVTPQAEGPTEEDLRKKPKKVRAKPGQRFAEQRRRAQEVREQDERDRQAAGPTPEQALKIQQEMAEALSSFIDHYRDKPVEFVERVLKAQPLDWQKEFLTEIARGTRRISVRAGHGVGKSSACAWALIWHLITKFPQKAICTAPTASQLFDALFAELKRWINEMPAPLRSMVEVFSDRIVLASAPESSFISARTSSSERPEALAGVHSEHVLLIVDEASAIPESVFESAAGSMSGHTATTILISNPTRNSGLFFRTHHQLKDDWKTMHVSCIGNRLVSEDFVDQIKATYGESSNAFRVRVLGEFALRDDDVLISADLVDSAMCRDVAASAGEPLVYGLDVARFGDDRTVLVKRQGNVLLEIKSWSGADTMETVGRVVNEAKQDSPAEICVDSIGLGSGVADRLRELSLNVRDVNVSESAALNPQAARLRDELWLSCKDWLGARNCRIPKDDDLRAELVSPTYNFTSTGKIKVEGKAEMKKRGLRSPDVADALCLTFAGQAALVGGRASKWISGKPLERRIAGII